MKILVVNPPACKRKDYIREGRCMQTRSSWAALWMPLSLCYISALLRKKGHEVRLIDCIADKTGIAGLIKISEDFRPEMVVLNTAIPSVKGDAETSLALKKALPETKIIVVGMYPTLYENECLEKFSQADFAITGEPEWAIANLTEAISRNDPVAFLKGLIFRKGNEIIINERQNLSENNLYDLPFPARDMINNNAYRLPTNGKKFTLLSVGRGCSGNCIYCAATAYYGRKFRKRSVERVVAEIEECIYKFDIRNFLFWGESFTTDQKYGEEICDEIISKNLKIEWSTTSRVDTLNQVLLDKMKKAGCILLGLGIESYDQDVLDKARKGITTDQINSAITMVRKAGISSMGHFVFGLPGDTRETARKSVKFACRNLTFAQFYCAIPYPKTDLERIAREQNWIKESDIEKYDLSGAVMRNETLTLKEIKKIRDYAYRKFYFRPVMLIRTMKEVDSFRSLLSIMNFIKWINPGYNK